ncbi:FKBP-type peptidyl-prolyl cis-trans isomerase [bacterium]|nr:FKBP-type peptidyl-prolyl cis-trans isomerase [bacterium]
MFTRTTTVLALVLGLAAPAFSQAKLDTDEQKTIYALGVALSQSLQPYYLTPDEVKLVQQGLVDGLANKEQIDLKDYRAKLQQLAQDRAKTAAEAEKKDAQGFLDKMAKEKGAQKSESGLIFFELAPGNGESPKATDTVKVHYHGTLRDGTVFDSSKERGTPATFPLNRVIPCWTEAVQKMKVGGKAKIICPSSIAYGDRGAPPKIKPGAPLVFEVELLEIEKPAAGASGAPGAAPNPAEKPAEKPASK